MDGKNRVFAARRSISSTSHQVTIRKTILYHIQSSFGNSRAWEGIPVASTAYFRGRGQFIPRKQVRRPKFLVRRVVTIASVPFRLFPGRSMARTLLNILTGRAYSNFLTLLVFLVCSLLLACLRVHATCATQDSTHGYSARLLVALKGTPPCFARLRTSSKSRRQAANLFFSRQWARDHVHLILKPKKRPNFDTV